VTGIGEVAGGDDLAIVLARHARLDDGDILVVTSKIVSKAERRVLRIAKPDAVAQETDRVLATRGETAIVRTHHGLVMAGAGVDASNTEPGTVVLLPRDPDSSARTLRVGLAAATGRNVAVVVSDTAGRAWRNGQTDIAVGAAGLDVLEDLSGRSDGYGNLLAVTAPALGDEIAAAADLVKGKLVRCPAAVVRGLSRLVLPAGRHGPGARILAREEAQDMFGYGAREAVLRALGADPGDLRGFGGPGTAGELTSALVRLGEVPVSTAGSGSDAVVTVGPTGSLSQRELGRLEARLVAAAFALGWVVADPDPGIDPATFLRFRPASP
jgi:coenzyme F420-0:L-glutamate ligase/coenzyme F420-1:gamma-L-glutamate ligase